MDGTNGNEIYYIPAEESWGEFEGIEFNSFCSDNRCMSNEPPVEGSNFFYPQNEEQQQVDLFVDNRLLDDLRFDMLSPSVLQELQGQFSERTGTESGIQEAEGYKYKSLNPSPLAAFELLNEHGRGFKSLNSKRSSPQGTDTNCTNGRRPELSTEEIIRMAAARFIQSSVADTVSMVGNPYDISLSELSEEEAENVQLAEFLLTSADKVGERLFERASKLLNHCDSLSSSTGNAVQRVIYYFSTALRERIDREMGKIMPKGLENCHPPDVDEALMVPNPTIPACHLGIPFYQLAHIAGVQAIVENVYKAKKVHVIDLKIRNGIHLTVLMQALASRGGRPLELLKVSAVGTSSKHLIKETGKRLTSFAQTLKISFSFKIVMVPKLEAIREDLFELDTHETVAVYSEYSLRTLIVQPNQVDSMMKVIKNMNPSIMVVIEVEANHNSPAFVTRFVEALFYMSAYFDCIDACMERDDLSRTTLESFYLGERIRNLVAIDGEERNTRNAKINVWRTYFSQLGMLETELSASSLFQMDLVLKKFACWRSCTLQKDGRSLLIGWKGTPLLSLSTWKFFTKRIIRF